MAAPRRRAREMALQALFEMEIGSHDPQETLERLCQESRAPEELAEFSKALLTGVLEHRAEIDEAIARVAPERPVAELSAVDRNLIRIAIRECMLDNLTPAGAAISEAVELAKKYGSDSSSRFVNGVLGSLSASGMTQEGK